MSLVKEDTEEDLGITIKVKCNFFKCNILAIFQCLKDCQNICKLKCYLGYKN